MGRERVAQSMARGAFGDAGSTYGFLHGSLDGGRVNVMAPPFGARLMGVGPRRRKHPLPRPLGGRTGRLALERVRQLDPPGPSGATVSGRPNTASYMNSNAAVAWFCVDALTRRRSARCVRNACTSVAPIVAGCRRS